MQQQMDTGVMVSSREGSNMLETGHKHGSLILAACKDMPASRVELPMDGYSNSV